MTVPTGPTGSAIDRCRAIRLHGNRRYLLRLESVASEGQRIGADGQIDEVIAAVGVGLEAAGQLGLVGNDGHVRIRQHASGLVRDRTSDAAERLLRMSGRCENTRGKYCEQGDEPDFFSHEWPRRFLAIKPCSAAANGLFHTFWCCRKRCSWPGWLA